MASQFDQGYALIIGVGGDLPVTVADAKALAALLRHPQRAAYPDQQVRLLVASDATRQNILQELDWLAGCAAANPTTATVVIYFSGHGRRIVNKSGNVLGYTLVPHGFNSTDLANTGISGAELTEKLNLIQPNKLLVLLDCCHAGGMQAKGADDEEFYDASLPFDLQKLASGGGRVVVASSRADEKSLTGSPNSVFTQCLLDALSGRGARQSDGQARILEVLSYLFEQVPNLAAPHSQHVFVNNILDLSDNFPLCFFTPSAVDAGALPGSLSKDAGPLTAAQRVRLKERYDSTNEEYRNIKEDIDVLRRALKSITVSAVTRQGLEQDLAAAEIRKASVEYHLGLMEERLAQGDPTSLDQAALSQEKESRAEQALALSQERLGDAAASDRQVTEALAQQEQAKVELLAVADEKLHRSLLTLNYFDQSMTFQRFKLKNTRRGAFLIRGQPYFGQKWLLTRLLDEAAENGLPGAASGKNIQTVPIILNLASLVKQNSLEEVWASLAGESGLDTFPLPPVNDILDGLLRRWQTQDLIIVMDDINKFTPAVLNPLLEQIWSPLAAAPLPANDHRLLLFMLDQENVTQDWAHQLNFVQDIGPQWLPSLPIHLPEISPVDAHELGSWFQHNYRSLPRELADQYVQNPELVQKVLTDTQGAPIKVLMMLCYLCGRKWKEKEKAWMIY